MIYERLDLNLDIHRLQEHLRSKVLPLEPVMQSHAFGGWSVLSSDGSYQDGWIQGHRYFVRRDGKDVLLKDELREAGMKDCLAYRVPTEICHGYLAQVMVRLVEMRLSPRRARISLLKAGGCSSLHRDGEDHQYAVRLHVPIVTNPGCTFECEEGAAHLPADGSAYILRVNRMHQVFNRGTEGRFHLIMDIWDIAGVTAHHRYPPSFQPASGSAPSKEA